MVQKVGCSNHVRVSNYVAAERECAATFTEEGGLAMEAGASNTAEEWANYRDRLAWRRARSPKRAERTSSPLY